MSVCGGATCFEKWIDVILARGFWSVRQNIDCSSQSSGDFSPAPPIDWTSTNTNIHQRPRSLCASDANCFPPSLSPYFTPLALADTATLPRNNGLHPRSGAAPLGPAHRAHPAHHHHTRPRETGRLLESPGRTVGPQLPDLWCAVGEKFCGGGGRAQAVGLQHGRV